MLLDLVRSKSADYKKNPSAAAKLARAGEAPASGTDPAEVAAWTTAMSVLLTLDETITKE